MIKVINETMLEEMAELFIDVFNREPWNDKWDKRTAEKRLLDFMHTPGFYGLACYEEEKMIGLILGCSEQYYDGVSFQIIEFCIAHTKQRQGNGKMLLNQLLLDLKEKGIENICLFTLHDPSTEGFYEKNGFKVNKHMIMMNKN